MSVTSRSLPTPSQLLFSLLHNDFKQIQCEDNRESIKKQIQFLHEELLIYQEQRERKIQFQKELEAAIEVRARLRVELQRLSRERRLLDMDAVDFVERVKMDPIEIRNLSKYQQELDEVMDQNSKMKVKLRELQDYANMLQKRIEIKQKENNIIQPTEILKPISPAPMIFLDRFGDLDWRQKIRAYKLEQKIYTENFKGNLQHQINRTSVAQQELNNQRLTGLQSGSKEFWRNFRTQKTNLDLWKRTF